MAANRIDKYDPFIWENKNSYETEDTPANDDLYELRTDWDTRAPEGEKLIDIKKWFNPPRDLPPPFGSGEIMIGRAQYEKRLRRVFNFKVAATFWIFGKRYSGKSTLLELILLLYLLAGGAIWDFFASRDNENLAWLRSPWATQGRVLLLVGDKSNLEFDKEKYEWMHVHEIKDQKDLYRIARDYDIVITCPGFYTELYEMYDCLSYLIDLLKNRIEFERVIALGVRESRQLIASRYGSGAVVNKQQAELDFIDLNDEGFHTGIAICVDSLRPMSIVVDVREGSTYTFIKKVGRMHIPDEFRYPMRYIQPKYLRKMPTDAFILYTDEDDILYGTNVKIDWHVKRGENIMSKLGIRKIPRPKEEIPKIEPRVNPNKPTEYDHNRKVDDEVIGWIAAYRENGHGKSFDDIQKALVADHELHLSVATIHKAYRLWRNKSGLDVKADRGP